MAEMKTYVETKEYVVTLHNAEHLSAFYNEMESKGQLTNSVIPERDVVCVDRRPSSRNTVYRLTNWEAQELKLDPRVRSVELVPSELGIRAGTTITQTSSNWDKSGSSSTPMKNWGLLRCTEGSQRTGWGGTGYQGNGSGTPAQTGTISLTQTGRNVDVVVVDGDGIVFDHPEYAVNADGTGGSRAIQYNWGQHDPAVKGTSASNYSYGTSDHATHVAGTVAGNTQGWARNANIYNIFYYAGAIGDSTFPYVMDYVREFHRTKSINPATGRKNPTITNNSWGMSIFPSEWALSDITAVTYRGTRFTPSGAVTYTGYSGVCTSNERLATLLGFENFGNRITTNGPYVPPGGSITAKPVSWEQEGQQTYFTSITAPDASYTVSVDAPADIELIHNIAINAVSGNITLSAEIVITDSNDTVINSWTDTDTTENGGTVETNIRQSYSLTGLDNYNITYNTTITGSDGLSLIYAVAMSLTVVTDAIGASASVTEITNNLPSTSGLTASTSPTSGNNDDGYWTINLPFTISYLGNDYTSVYVGTNTYLTFSAGSSVYSSLGPSTPNFPKIMWSCADNSVQRIYYGVEGTAPNRTYRIRVEGTASTGGSVGSPNMVNEYVFYEATPAQIDLQLGTNARKLVGGGFTTEQLNAWGFIASQRIPVRVAALDADIENAIDEGIIYVGAAGNGRWKHDVPGGPDWDNTFEMGNRYPGSVTQPYYYMRGTSPTANDTTANGGYDIPNICVGSVDTIQIDQKVQYSDCGPGVDIWAPGTYIISALPFAQFGLADDPRGGGAFKIGKFSGTSMASPQVCGVLACALEQNPHWNQVQAKAYITGIAKEGQLVESSGGPTDGQDLQDAPNLYLYYRKDRPETGLSIPRDTGGVRPSTGQLWPRPKIHRWGI